MSITSAPRSMSTATPRAGINALAAQLAAFEKHLAALGTALQQQDHAQMDHHSEQLRMSLTHLSSGFAQLSQQGPLPPAVQRRLQQTRAQLQEHQATLLRVSLPLTQALQLLCPTPAPLVYSRGH